MRAGRSDADFEEFEEAGVHDLITTEIIVKANDAITLSALAEAREKEGTAVTKEAERISRHVRRCACRWCCSIVPMVR
jgi:hypothetical protein